MGRLAGTALYWHSPRHVQRPPETSSFSGSFSGGYSQPGSNISFPLSTETCKSERVQQKCPSASWMWSVSGPRQPVQNWSSSLLHPLNCHMWDKGEKTSGIWIEKFHLTKVTDLASAKQAAALSAQSKYRWVHCPRQGSQMQKHNSNTGAKLCSATTRGDKARGWDSYLT